MFSKGVIELGSPVIHPQVAASSQRTRGKSIFARRLLCENCAMCVFVVVVNI